MPLDVQLLAQIERVAVFQSYQCLFSGLFGLEADESEVFIGVLVLLDEGRVDLSELRANFIQGFPDFLFSVLRVLNRIRQVLEVKVLSVILSVGLLLEDLGSDDLFLELKVQGSLDAFLGGLDGVELDIPVSSGFTVLVVTDDGGEDAPELGELLIKSLSSNWLV